MTENLSQKTKQIIEISSDPTEFRYNTIAEFILSQIHLINEGKTTKSDAFCRCSRFELDELIRMGVKGEFSSEINGKDPIGLAKRLTDYLWEEICRIWNEENKSAETISEIQQLTHIQSENI